MPEAPTGPDPEGWMKMALKLARKGRGSTSPNPAVGAVVVSASGELAGTGWHRGPGEPHAEVLAVAEAGKRAKGSTVFVSLEPCAHFGRTPPCVGVLLESDVSAVFCAMEDPDPRVSGRGIAALRQGGIDVRVGLCAAEATELNRAYITHRTKKRPYVTLKMAASVDGRTSAADGSSRWISGEAARRDVHRLRAGADAVCVGAGTVAADDPSLSVRGVPARRMVSRVVVDPMARTSPGAKVLAGEAPTFVYVSARAQRVRVDALTAAGAQVVTIASDSPRIPLQELLRDLAERSVMDLLVEGGPRLAGSFVAANLVDRYLFYFAPKLLGGPPAGPVMEGWAAESIAEARLLRISSTKQLGEDWRIEAFPAEQFPEPGM